MKFNGDRMHSILSEYLQAVKRLEELAALKEEEFLADPHKVASAKYHLVICIEAAIDLSNHLIAKKRLRVPEDYADTFRIMGENGLFPQDFVPKLTAMAGFRNRLVHRYWDVDNKKVFLFCKKIYLTCTSLSTNSRPAFRLYLKTPGRYQRLVKIRKRKGSKTPPNILPLKQISIFSFENNRHKGTEGKVPALALIFIVNGGNERSHGQLRKQSAAPRPGNYPVYRGNDVSRVPVAHGREERQGDDPFV